jgi:hypothetical protein
LSLDDKDIDDLWGSGSPLTLTLAMSFLMVSSI